MDSELIQILDSQNWKEIMKKLYAHSLWRLQWFGVKSNKRMQGKQFKDFAHEAVTLVYEGKRNWDYIKEPNLVNYLKNVINSRIWSLINSNERKKLQDLDLTMEINDFIFFNQILENSILKNDLIEKIENTILKDELMKLVFNSLTSGLSPSDISDKHNIKIEDIRNAQKRLRRHINGIIILK